MAYLGLFYALFESILPEYSSPLVTIEALFNTVMGAFDFEIISENNRTLGAITFFPFMIIVQNAYCSQRLLNYTDELFCRSPRR